MPTLEPGNVSPQGLSSAPLYGAKPSRNFRTEVNGPSHQRGGHSQRRVRWKLLQVKLPGAASPLGSRPLAALLRVWHRKFSQTWPGLAHSLQLGAFSSEQPAA